MMREFSAVCPVVFVAAIEPIAGADRLELLRLSNGIEVVTGKHYLVNQRGIYIPAGVIIPGWMAEDMWLYGSSKAMREPFFVREIELMGMKSPGLFCGQSYIRDKDDPRSVARFEKLKSEGGQPSRHGDDAIVWPMWRSWWQLGDNVAVYLGIRAA
jgi:hypothetical protein